jgi:hypothetical protein
VFTLFPGCEQLYHRIVIPRRCAPRNDFLVELQVWLPAGSHTCNSTELYQEEMLALTIIIIGAEDPTAEAVTV